MSPTRYQMAAELVPAIVAQFEANKQAQVDAINADITDGFTIELPQQIVDFAPTPATLEGSLPLLGIADFPTRFEDDLVHSTTSVCQFAIMAAIADPDQRALAWKLRRYRTLIANLIQVDRTFGGKCWTTLFDQIAPGPYMANTNPERDLAYLSWFYFLITCRRDE